jgi:ABC-type nitrate/sulfonate/bicarbonate transport system substrate-binding protein
MKSTGLTARVAIASLFLGLMAIPPAFPLDRVNLHISGSGSPFPLIYRVGQEKGYYADEGLEVLPIAANLLTGIQGLAAGSFDFSQILGQGSAAILRGFPLKIVMAFDTRPLWWLYGKKQFKSAQDLKGGKQVAVASFGSAVHQTTVEMFSKHGIDPARDVLLRPIGNDPDRLAALLNGTVDAAVLNQASRAVARKNGLQELLFYGNEIDYVTAGIVVAEKTLTQRSDFTLRFLRGTLRAFVWFKSNQTDVISSMMHTLKISESEADDIYKSTVQVLSPDGTIPREVQERMVTFQRKALKIEKEVTADQVYDFRIVRSLNQSLGKPY